MGDDPGSSIAFAEKLLSLLDTGSFTTSYKYALLLGIIDATLEGTARDGSPPAVLRGRDLGRRVFARYWHQARPFGDAGPLRQSKQRDAVVKIAELRARLALPEHTSLDAARALHPQAIDRIEREVVTIVVRYPIPLLQRFGSAGTVEDRFIYDLGWSDGVGAGQLNRPDFDDRLHLRPGAGERLLEVAGLVRPVVEREWLRHVARRNDDQVDDLRLESFLFGATRTALVHLRDPLLGLQLGRCFYCRGDRGAWEVDHFLPWARWPDDRLDNLVVAHRACNNDKRAALAGLDHLERWWIRLSPTSVAGRRLADIGARLSWPRRPERTASGARALYLHQPDGAMLWVGRGEVEALDVRRLQAVLEPAPGVAAEAPPERYGDA